MAVLLSLLKVLLTLKGYHRLYPIYTPFCCTSLVQKRIMKSTVTFSSNIRRAANKALHWMAIPLRSIATSELVR